MREHFSSKEITEWLVEGPTAEAAAHLRECGSCRAMLAEAQAPLRVFRSAVVAWSEGQVARPLREATRWQELRERMNFMNWGPAFGVAVGVAVLAAFLVRSPTDQKVSVPQHPQQQQAQISDAALMEQVDAEVSETVPDAMAPLTDLVAWDGDGTQGATSAQASKARAGAAD
jgi:predicted anti-sigma-YlaC factor YlaD